MSTAIYTEKTFNGKTVRVIKADMDCVSVEEISGSVLDSGKFGVNGTFFDTSGLLLGIAINNGAAVKNGGTQTGQACNVSTKRGTMYCYNPSYQGSTIDTEVVKNYLDTGASANQIKWAIGGYSLHPNASYTKSQYLNAINGSGSANSCSNAQTDTENAFRLSPDSSVTPRTAIGWDGSKIVLAVFQAENAYEVRQFMKNEGCNSHAIMLDGGRSSQMRAFVASPSGNFIATYDPGDENRKVYNMVAVNPTTWVFEP